MPLVPKEPRPQAAILAGGLGTRLRPLTHRVPKPMVPIAGAPYLEHQLRYLQRQGLEDVVLLVGYLSEQIERYFGDGRWLGLNIRYSREPAPLGTGGALRHARQLLNDAFLLLYGDSFLPVRYLEVLGALADPSTQGVVVVYDARREDTGVTPNVALHPDGMVARYAKDAPDRAGLNYVEAGVLALRKQVLDLMPRDGAVSLEKEVFPRLIARQSLRGFTTDQRFYDIGTPERLDTIEQYFQRDHYAHTLSD